MIYTLTLNPALDRELTVPKLVFDKVLRTTIVQVDYGGKGFNVSRALAAMGIKSIALGFIGGFHGDQIENGLAGLGIQSDFVRLKGETRTNISIVDFDHLHYVKVNEPGPFVSVQEADQLEAKIEKLAAPGDWWILAGSTPPGVDTDFIIKIIKLIQSSGANTAVDMEGQNLRAAWHSHPTLLKANANEASDLLGLKIISLEDALNALSLLHMEGTRYIAISLGKDGAVYTDEDGTWYAQPPEIMERNPIGAGDAMLSGMLWALNNKLHGVDVLRWGIACGAAAASLDGTAVGSLQMVTSLFPHVKYWKAAA